MRIHETKGARSMQSHPEERIDSRPESGPMAIIGAILARGAIRFLDRQKREQRAAEKSISTADAATKLSAFTGGLRLQEYRARRAICERW